MLEPVPAHPATNPLDRLLSANAGTRLAAAQELAQTATFTPRILAALETAAAGDLDPAVRQAALAGLDSQAARRLRAMQALPLAQRVEILEQLERWRTSGRLTHEQASTLRLRYTFDIAPISLSTAGQKALHTQVDQWFFDELINTEQAGRLHASLNSAGETAIPSTQPAAAAGQSQPAGAGQTTSAAPVTRQSLQEILFSEVSIRIALFLGGFLVVAAALILAAVLEYARLPILLGVTALTGAAALILRRRLALPSFVLFIIFASLLLIDAGVAADLLGIDGRSYLNHTINGYWAVVLAVETVLLAAASLLYRSRLFNLAALLVLDAAVVNLAVWWDNRYENFLFLIALAGLASTVWQAAGKQRAGKQTGDAQKSALRLIWPLHWATHLQTLLLLAVMSITTLVFFVMIIDPSASETVEPVQLLLLGAAWLATAAFYLINDRWVKPLAPLPLVAAGSLLFAPWCLLAATPAGAPWIAAGMAASAIAAALFGNHLALVTSEAADSLARRRYGIPLLAAAAGLLLWAAMIGWSEDMPTAFGVLLAAGLLYTGLHAQKARAGLWLAALLAYTAAYFTFFQLGFAQAWEVDLNYQIAGISLLLLLPDLLPLRGAKPGTAVDRNWLVLARLLGAALTAINTLLLSVRLMTAAEEISPATHSPDWLVVAWVMSIMGLFLLAYAARRTQPVLYAAAAYLFAGLACWLVYYDQRPFIVPHIFLAAGFYLAGLGLLLARRKLDWSAVLRNCGLGLSAALVIFLPFRSETGLGVGLALLLGSIFFLVEVHIQRGGWLALPLLALAALAFPYLLRALAHGPFFPNNARPGFDLFGISLIFLGWDLYQSRRGWPADTRLPMLQQGVRILGGMVAAACVLFWIFSTSLPARIPAVLLALYTLFLMFMAWGHRQPRLGYPAFAALAGCLFYAMRAAGFSTWLAPEILLAGALYGSSFLLMRLAGSWWWASQPWAAVRRNSGLALAMLVSFTAPLENSGLWESVWVAVAATIYAIEAFRRRNVWWGFPANGLYLLAYFILLVELKVREPQYFSVGVAVLGLLMHYLLVRSGSGMGAFLTGMVSQLVLLGTTYIQMVATNRLSFFVMLFFQGLVVLAYGIVIRSRSLVLAPVIFIVLGVITVVLSVLSGVPTAIIIGCTGVLLLGAGILALLMRERLAEFSDRFGSWRA